MLFLPHCANCPGLTNIPEVETIPQSSDQDDDKWLQFIEGETILKKGFVNKRKGLFARKRMFLLTTGPRLFYIDPVSMVKKGEIPWSPELRVEAKNFKIFFVHTVSITVFFIFLSVDCAMCIHTYIVDMFTVTI